MKLPDVTISRLDKMIGALAPGFAFKRLKARAAMALFSSYAGADKSGRWGREWNPAGLDPDEDLNLELPDLRNRSRDLVRNDALAGGAIKTKITHVIGTGLNLRSRIDRDVLGLSEEQADAFERLVQREWSLFWDAETADAARTCTGTELTRMAYRGEKENGDAVALLPRITRLGVPYTLTVQLVESDRLCNKDHAPDGDGLSGGVKKDKNGAPAAYHIARFHPGAVARTGKKEWDIVPAFGKKTGLRNVIHLYRPTRPGQSRGVPDLAPVVQALKQLSRYTEAEIMAAVIAGYFTVFVESEAGGATMDLNYGKVDGKQNPSGSSEIRMGSGVVVGLRPGEKVETANPGRPNANYEGFVIAILRQIGAALEIPFEILIKHFTASYSASQAALLEFHRYVMAERKWLTDNFLRPIFEHFMWEAVSSGRIAAPGFFADPGIRKAYLGSKWVGPARGHINEVIAANAAQKRLEAKLTTLDDETVEYNGGDWEVNHVQQVKENKKQIEGRLKPDPAADPAAATPQGDDDE